MRDHLELFLKEEGFSVSTAVDGPAALAWVASSPLKPDLVLADYNLPNGMNGVDVAQRLRLELDRQIPFIILTGDITTEALRNIALHDCVQFNKPVKLRELTQAIDKLLAQPSCRRCPTRSPDRAAGRLKHGVIYVVDDDDQIRGAIRVVLEDDGRIVETYPTCEAFLAGFRPNKGGCLLIDAYLPGMSGLELLQKLRADGHALPAIMITGDSDVTMAVQAMKTGASDFIEKPIGRDELIASIDRALELSGDFHQTGGMARVRGLASGRIDRASTRGNGAGSGRPSEQEHRRRPRHQPAHRRKPSRLDHEAHGIKVPAGAGAIGAGCGGRQRRAGAKPGRQGVSASP